MNMKSESLPPSSWPGICRIQTRSPWLPRPYHGAGLGLSPPKNLALFLDLKVACRKQILIHNSGDLTTPVVFAECPLTQFSASRETFSIPGREREWQLCWFFSTMVVWALRGLPYQVSSTGSLNTTHAYRFLSFYPPLSVGLRWVLITGSQEA